MIKIYYSEIKKKLKPEVFDKFLNELPLTLQERILRFRRWQDAQASLFGKLLLKKGLEDFGLDSDLTKLKFTKYNRPYTDNFLDFNISHSGDYVFCAFSSYSKIGIDIEEVKPISIDDFNGVFTDEEFFSIKNSDDSYQQFYNYWTMKEAIIKADGRGLNISLKNIIIDQNKTRAMITDDGEISSYSDDESWCLKKIAFLNNYVLHIAVKSNRPVKYQISECNFDYQPVESLAV